MQTFIEKFYPRTKSQKAHMIMFLACLLFILGDYFLSIKGRGMPLKQDLIYTTGILDYYSTLGKDAQRFAVLRSEPPASKEMVFGCNYSAYISQASNGCMDTDRVAAYLGKQATAGWYYQPKFLGFENNTLQLVSLEVDGNYLMTYDKTVSKNKRGNVLLLFVRLFFITFYSYLYFLVFYPKNTSNLTKVGGI